jgi:hypothetical protein
MPDHTTPEGRLEGFIDALAADDMTLIPPTYVASDVPTPMIDDLREVLARLVKAEAADGPA